MSRPAPALLPVALVLYLGFLAGGYPPGVTSYAAVMLALLLAIRALAGDLARPGRVGVAAVIALALLGAWTLLSALWSDAAIRAILDTDRVILYALVVASFATLRGRPLPQVIRGFAAAVVVIAAAALIARLLFGIEPALSPHRLTWPLTYWNSLGLLMGFGLVLCLHLSSDLGATRWERALWAAAVPALACAVYLTQSRAGYGLAAAGVVAYAILARPPGLVGAAAALLPGTVLVLVDAMANPGLIGLETADSVVRSEGRELAVAIVLSGALSAFLRGRVTRLDDWAQTLHLPRPSGRAQLALAAVGLVLVVGATVASGTPSKVYDRFTAPSPPHNPDPRARLLQLSNAGRVDQWRVALRASRDHRVLGTGAGTFGLAWDRLRQLPRQATEAHSLYVETLAELGVVGLALLAAGLTLLLAAPLLARGAPRADRALVVVVFVMWLAHAALEWDWEMPAVTVVPLALAAASVPSGARVRSGAAVGLAVVAVLLAVLPALTALSAVQADAALRAYDAGDCSEATTSAARARALLPARPQPQLVAGLCAAREGDWAAAESRARQAVRRDPDNWEYHYDLAVVIAASGRDPTAELEAVRRLSAIPVELDVLGLTGSDLDRSRRTARVAPMLIDRRRHAPISDGG